MSRAKDEGSNGIFIRHNYTFTGKLLGRIDQLSVDNAIILKGGVSFDPEGSKCKAKGRRSCEKKSQQKIFPRFIDK